MGNKQIDSFIEDSSLCNTTYFLSERTELRMYGRSSCECTKLTCPLVYRKNCKLPCSSYASTYSGVEQRSHRIFLCCLVIALLSILVSFV